MINLLCTLAVVSCKPEPVIRPELRQITAYTLSVDETDATPNIGATNEDLSLALERGESICAANWLPLNSIITIEGYGSCRIADRMAKKNGQKVDILMKTKQQARQWGKQAKLVTKL